MKILLTGASGVIGSAVLPRLIQANHEVTLLSRPTTAAALRQQWSNWGFRNEILEAETHEWASAIGDRVFDACLHLAWVRENPREPTIGATPPARYRAEAFRHTASAVCQACSLKPAGTHTALAIQAGDRA